MRLLSFISLLAVPVTVLACEGECIVGVTNAWLGNYTARIDDVCDNLARQIVDLIPSHPSLETARTYLEPIRSAYRNQSYAGMERAIFPNFFHGKCLDEDGNTPPGCPNPDCPVVCGTPGSMVHFYSKLRYIAFNQTYHLLQALSTPGSDTYQQVEDAVVAAAKQSPQRRRIYSRIYGRGLGGVPVNAMQNNEGSSSPAPTPGAGTHSEGEDELPGSAASSGDLLAMFPGFSSGGLGSSSPSSAKKVVPGLMRRSPDVKDGLKSIMDQVHPLIEEGCGGSGQESTNGLPDCSWETEMKEYILGFP